MPRARDIIAVQGDAGSFTKFSRLRISNDILSPSEATFEIGDDGAFAELEQVLAVGSEFKVTLNERPRMTGRVEVRQVPGRPDDGVVIELTVRTKTSDARVSSADPKIKVEKTSIKDFIVALYEPLGLSESDFIFGDFTARDLITGEAKGAKAPIDFEPIKTDQAKVRPPETIYQAAERHLKRYGATQWDAPDGRIVIGAPDDTQEPLYRLLCRKGADSVGNNVGAFRKVDDFTESPYTVEAYGASAGKEVAKSPIRAIATNPSITAVAGGGTRHFNRRVIVPTQSGKTQAEVDRMVLRELSARRRREDAWEFTVDGWTYWNGQRQIPWANNATVDIDIQVVGGPRGRYLIVRTDLDFSTDSAITTKLQCVAPGIWVI